MSQQICADLEYHEQYSAYHRKSSGTVRTWQDWFPHAKCDITGNPLVLYALGQIGSPMQNAITTRTVTCTA
jgi:hypothetical protein